MGGGIFRRLLGSLEAAGGNRRYRLLDGIKSAFAVFFFLHPLLLDFQRAMKERRKRDNLETLFGVMEIPSDNQIRTLLDGIEPSALGEAFERNLRRADEAGALESYRVLEGGVLLALDGLWRYSLKEVHCEHCRHAMDRKGETTYYWYRCPAKKELAYKGHVQLNRNSGEKYQAKSGDCKDCALQRQCIAGRGGKSPKRTLFIADKSQKENLCDRMRKKIDGAKHRVLYGRRMQIIEPCFSDMSYCKGMNRFSVRTKIKADIQWLLYCIAHNIGKCIPEIAAGSGG
ncbi:MAG: transposase [Treponema sp.]|jgi:hypothetical protein|nr:transposase [Treponema sp.]